MWSVLDEGLVYERVGGVTASCGVGVSLVCRPESLFVHVFHRLEKRRAVSVVRANELAYHFALE